MRGRWTAQAGTGGGLSSSVAGLQLHEKITAEKSVCLLITVTASIFPGTDLEPGCLASLAELGQTSTPAREPPGFFFQYPTAEMLSRIVHVLKPISASLRLSLGCAAPMWPPVVRIWMTSTLEDAVLNSNLYWGRQPCTHLAKREYRCCLCLTQTVMKRHCQPDTVPSQRARKLMLT